MIRRLVLCCALLSCAPVLAGQTVAVVVDRSASLRYADPEGRGPRLMALALALALEPGDRVVVFASGTRPGTPGVVAADPGSLAPLVQGFLGAAPRPGGDDLTVTVGRAVKAVGRKGLVFIYTDDDLDVVDGQGKVPEAILKRARKANPRPTRTDVNQAASELLAARVRRAKVRVLGLRALLPPGGRSTPFLEALEATTVDLVDETYDVVRRLAEQVRGEPIVSHAAPVRGRVELPYAARVALLADAGARIGGGAALDSAARLWVADVDGPVELQGEALALVSPRLKVPGELIAYGLRNGEIHVAAFGDGLPSGGGDALALGHGSQRVVLAGSPLRGKVALEAGNLPRKITVLRMIREGSNEAVVAARRPIDVQTPEVVLLPVKGARAHRELELVGRPSRGLRLERLPIEAREAGGAVHQLEMFADAEGLLRVRFIPRSDGPLGVSSQGPLDLRVDQEIDVAEAEAQRLKINSARLPGGDDLGGETALVLDGEQRGSFEVEVQITPKPPQPLAVSVHLSGAPEGTKVEPAGPFTVGEKQVISLALRWPEGADGTAISLRVEAENAEPDSWTIPVEPGAGPLRYVAAGLLLLVAFVWGVFLYRRWTRVDRFLDNVVKGKQLRVVGRNGRLSPERYRFADFLDEEDLSIVVEPDESPGGMLEFDIRKDGTVFCTATGGAQVVHADRPTILAETTVLTHGTPFAMVYKNRALRYVYLDGEPNAEELTTAYLADAMTHDEAAMRDSGVFLILDDEAPNVPRYSARLEASTEMLTMSQEIMDSKSEVAVMPGSGEMDAPLVSDEGVIYMDSAEGQIMDSAEISYIDDSDDEASYKIDIDDLYDADDD